MYLENLSTEELLREEERLAQEYENYREVKSWIGKLYGAAFVYTICVGSFVLLEGLNALNPFFLLLFIGVVVWLYTVEVNLKDNKNKTNKITTELMGRQDKSAP